MKLLARTLFVSSVALSTAFLGGIASADEATGTDASPVTGAPAESAQPHSRRADAARQILAQLDLSPQQRAQVESIARITKDQDRNMRVAGKKLAAAIADEVAQGRVDANTLAPQVNALADAAQCHAPAMQAALDELHRVLDHDQRNKLVDLVEQTHGAAHHVLTTQRWLESFGQRLGLNDQQKEQYQAILQKYEPTIREHREVFHKMLEAFRNDSFSAANAMPSYNPEQHARQMAGEMIELAQASSRILTPEQRKEAARLLESRLQPHGEAAQAPEGKENVGNSQQRIIVGGFGYPGFGFGGLGFNRFGFGGFGGFGGFNSLGFRSVGIGGFGYPGVGFGGFGVPYAGGWGWPGVGLSTAAGYPFWGGWSSFW